MQTEFFYTDTNTFKSHDYIKVIGQDWKPLEEATEQELKIFHCLFSADSEINTYMRNRFANGIKDTRELVRCCIRKFFGKLTQEPDIDEEGKLHKETH